MPIPDYQTLMLPLLRLSGDGTERAFREAVERLADEFALTDAERAELLPSGAAQVFGSRVGWARTYLKQAGLLETPKRGVLRITSQGSALLATSPARVDNNVLNRYESFRAFRARGREADYGARTAPIEAASEQTPEDAMAAAYQRVRKNLEPNCWSKSARRRPPSSSAWSSISSSQWGTAARAKTPAARSVEAAKKVDADYFDGE